MVVLVKGPSLDDFVEHFKNVSNTPYGEFSLLKIKMKIENKKIEKSEKHKKLLFLIVCCVFVYSVFCYVLGVFVRAILSWCP